MFELLIAAALTQADTAPQVPHERLVTVAQCMSTNACRLQGNDHTIDNGVVMRVIMVRNVEMQDGRSVRYGYGVFGTTDNQFGVTIIDPNGTMMTIRDDNLDGWADHFGGSMGGNMPDVGGPIDRNDRNFKEVQDVYYVAMAIILNALGFPTINDLS